MHQREDEEQRALHNPHLEVQDRLMRSKHMLHCFSKFADAVISNVVNQISGHSNFREFRITLGATKAFARARKFFRTYERWTNPDVPEALICHQQGLSSQYILDMIRLRLSLRKSILKMRGIFRCMSILLRCLSYARELQRQGVQRAHENIKTWKTKCL